MSLGERFPPLSRIIVPYSSGLSSPMKNSHAGILYRLLDHEDEGTTVLSNVWNRTIYTASQPRRLVFYATIL
jgi:hypothetical protein